MPAAARFGYVSRVSTASNQSKYQVRFDWGIAGIAAIAPGAQILVWTDALVTPDAPDPIEASSDIAVVVGTVGNRAEVASWVLARQVELGDRATIAVVAAGGADGRFSVEDLLAAGAVIDALGDVGIDFVSPEAAAAAAAFGGLRNATSHLLSASVTGVEIIEEHGREPIAAAKKANAEPSLRVLRELVLPA